MTMDGRNDVDGAPSASVSHVGGERHRGMRAGWLRAGVLGANDGLISTASLMMAVSAAGSGRRAILIAGLAGLVSGSLSMAAGEYVSVSSQHDVENADLDLERRELADDPDLELAELTSIYRRRGLDESLASEVAIQLSKADALSAHARDELGIQASQRARPIQAALVSALSFSLGALVPVLVSALSPQDYRVVSTTVVTLLGLGALGVAGAAIGGASKRRGTVRVLFGGALALAFSSAIGGLVGSVT